MPRRPTLESWNGLNRLKKVRKTIGRRLPSCAKTVLVRRRLAGANVREYETIYSKGRIGAREIGSLNDTIRVLAGLELTPDYETVCGDFEIVDSVVIDLLSVDNYSVKTFH
jgi:hypothetical protein